MRHAKAHSVYLNEDRRAKLETLGVAFKKKTVSGTINRLIDFIFDLRTN